MQQNSLLMLLHKDFKECCVHIFVQITRYFLPFPPPTSTYLKMNDVSKMTVQRSDTELDHKRNNVGKSDEKTE